MSCIVVWWKPRRAKQANLSRGCCATHGQCRERLEAYRQLLADARTGPDERAYVLFRAIRCYASSGQNHCTGPGVPISERKEWFHTLKTRFAASPWAAQLKYYW